MITIGRMMKMAAGRGAFRTAAITKTLICINDTGQYELSGFLFNPYMKEAWEFGGVREFLDIMDNFFDEVGFPQAVYTMRDFRELKKTERPSRRVPVKPEICQDPSAFDTMRGGIATFTVQVNFRQNATWQGSVYWAERDLTQDFRSTLELIRLMEAAFVSDGGTLGGWEDRT